MDWKKIAGYAIAGFLAAVLVDLRTWLRTEPREQFDWKLAATRWVEGAVSGAMVGMGVANAEG
jgi:hypothetical protein